MQFFNSKTMITPGIAGGLTTLITGVVTTQFNLPGKWVGLAISFSFGLTVFLLDKEDSHFILRLLCLVLNTFIIFSVAIGANTAGIAATTKAAPSFEASQARRKPFFHDWFS